MKRVHLLAYVAGHERSLDELVYPNELWCPHRKLQPGRECVHGDCMYSVAIARCV